MNDKKFPRILTFDLLRGYFLVAIILDHLAYYPNGLDWWSGRGNLFVSSAEGFFFISGIVLGIVRGAKLLDQPFWTSARLLLRRGAQLYIAAVVLMLLFTFVGWLFIDNPGLKPGIRPPDQNLWEVIWGAATFHYLYGWSDYLRLYAIFILASPAAIWALRRGWWYVVLIISVIIWGQYRNSPFDTAELSQLYSWQLIFFGGLIVGFHWQTIRGWWLRLPPPFIRAITTATVTLTLCTMVATFVFAYGTDLFGLSSWCKTTFDTVHVYFAKESLPWPRLLLFLLWFGGAFWLFTYFEQPLRRWLGWLFLRFGTNSLYVYTVQAIVVFAMHLFVPSATPWLFINLALSLIGVGLVWVALRTRFLMGLIPR